MTGKLIGSYQVRVHMRDLDGTTPTENESPDPTDTPIGDESPVRAPTIDEINEAVADALSQFGYAVSVTSERLDI